ncbi:trehalase-like domain-containing protein [Streptomyces mirabilis]|uniref:trehalase-like domain-containing protein n=1 Tax=Streptomyces mirabilis TaxID=68239 RepID=UPI0033A51AD5
MNTPKMPNTWEAPNTRESVGHDAYPPQALHGYAFLADGERGALVGPRGEISWLCAPRWHSGAVFSTLIGGTGFYGVTPRARFAPAGHYEEGSLIWRNRWVTEGGIVECREALAFPGEQGRPVLLRRVRTTEGQARVRVVLHPVAEYGTQPLHAARRSDDGVWTVEVGDLHLRWTGGGDALALRSRPYGWAVHPRPHPGRWTVARPGARTQRVPAVGRTPSDSVHVVVPDRTRLVGRRARTGQHRRHPRRTAGLRRTAGHAQRRRRHGRRGEDESPGAFRGRTQL